MQPCMADTRERRAIMMGLIDCVWSRRTAAIAVSTCVLVAFMFAVQIEVEPATTARSEEQVVVEMSVGRSRPQPATPADPGTDAPPRGPADSTTQKQPPQSSRGSPVHNVRPNPTATVVPVTPAPIHGRVHKPGISQPARSADNDATAAASRDSKYFPRTDCNRSGCFGVQFPGPTPPLRTRPEDTVLLPSVCLDRHTGPRDKGKVHKVGGHKEATLPECRLHCLNTPTCIAWQHGTPSTTLDDPLKKAFCGLFGQLM